MRLLRQLSRRKLRTTLTILGITIGIWALVVFSSMANKINSLVAGGSEYFTGKILVTDATNFAVGAGIAPMNISAADQMRELDDVAAVDAQIQMIYDPEASQGFGPAEFLLGSIAGSDEGRETFAFTPVQGRLLTPADEGSNVVVFGSDLARKQNAKIDDTVDIRGESFTVVGILEPTLTAPDTMAIIPLQAAQQLMAASLPQSIRDAISADELISQVVVYPKPGVDDAELAAEIERDVDNVQTLTGAEFDEQVGAFTGVFNAIIIGVAVISLVVGGLSVINTMAMSVAERTREIGIKRAIGGSRRRIIRELVTEAAVIGFIGGVIGLVLGATVVVLANEAGRSSGTILFELTPGTAIFAVSFSTILGMIAGVIPAWSAARLDPVEALRYE
ncbi:MAG TPA: ABC transporter permease [Candidatus Limnocylindria bacterium]|nr:ABC transporter permease [Candidatus Limnocylindria bacterium]